METLSGKPLLRRVLATLPAWYSDEDEARLDAEAAKIDHERVRQHSLEEMVAELAANPFAQVDGRPMDAEEVTRCLDWLAAQGWVVAEDVPQPDLVTEGEDETEARVPQAPVRCWRMTQAGLEELHRPEAAAPNIVPGPVALDLQPATATDAAETGVSADA